MSVAHMLKSLKARKIGKKTCCFVGVSRNKSDGVMFTLKAFGRGGSNRQSRSDVEMAIDMLEMSLHDYVKEVSAHRRLSYELRAGSPPSPFVIAAETSGAVQISQGGGWIQLLELSCVRTDLLVKVCRAQTRLQLKRDVQQRIWNDTKCSVEVYNDGGPSSPLTLCRPYVIIQGKELGQVERATAMVTRAWGG